MSCNILFYFPKQPCNIFRTRYTKTKYNIHFETYVMIQEDDVIHYEKILMIQFVYSSYPSKLRSILQTQLLSNYNFLTTQLLSNYNVLIWCIDCHKYEST